MVSKCPGDGVIVVGFKDTCVRIGEFALEDVKVSLRHGCAVSHDSER